MNLAPGRYRFDGNTLVPVGDSSLELLAADSWLTIDGKTVALERHLTRFTDSCNAQGLVNAPRDFLSVVQAELPQTGEWFPRIELSERGELVFNLRPAPQRTSILRIWSAESDPRLEPAIKGPDIARLEELRSDARLRGADEAIIVSDTGDVVDGTTTCLLWWRDGALHHPSLSFARVASVSAGLVTERANDLGIAVIEKSSKPQDIAGAELWAVNALHGIRPVVEWIDGPSLTVNETRLADWRTWYESLRQP